MVKLDENLVVVIEHFKKYCISNILVVIKDNNHVKTQLTASEKMNLKSQTECKGVLRIP